MIKTQAEIAFIRKACTLTDQCFGTILPSIKPTVSEKYIAKLIRTFFKDRGVRLAFPPIVAFGVNSCEPHHKTNNTLLKNRDIILLDFGCRVNRYCSDMSRTVFIGKPKPEWIRAYRTVLKAQETVLRKLKSVRSGAALDKLARNIIEKSGFPPYPHSLGHNVGKAIHELPRLTIKKDRTFLPGMVFSVEPGIYVDGRYGIRIEDLVLLTHDGIEILTKSPKKLLVL